MELLYVWIEDCNDKYYRNEFYFSSKYRFKFEPTNYEIDKSENGKERKMVSAGTLSYEKYESDNIIPENFFGNDIINITAFVGENGAGKSNFLKFIMNEFWVQTFWTKNMGRYFNFVAVMKFEDAPELYYSSIGLEVNSPEIEELNVQNKKLNGIKNLIFYSNQLDTFRKLMKVNDKDPCHSISLTDQLSEKEFSIQKFNTNKILEQVEFIKDNPKIILPFNVPAGLSMKIIFPFFISLPDMTYNPEFGGTIGIIEEKCLNSKTANNLEKIILVIKSCLVKYIAIRIIEDSAIPPDYRVHEYIPEMDHVNELNEKLKLEDSLFSEVIDTFLNHFNTSNYINREGLGIFIQAVEYIFKNKIIEFPLDKKSDLICFLSMDEIKYLLEPYKSLGYEFLHFHWWGLSSGEEAMLSLYSRFNSVAKEIKESKEKFVLILIDEGEVGFHPEWQRTYLKNLIDFFPQIYPDKQIQIILTTHSPFLASDLPKENIIFLQKGKKGEVFSDGTDAEGKCIVVDGLNEKKQTFGANIHTLFSDSFFLDGGLIGEFAKGKINEIIEFYKKVKILFEENNSENNHVKQYYEFQYSNIAKDNFKKIQKLIGEEYLAEIIKNHLEELDFILLKRDIAKQEKILRLEKEIEELKKETT